MDFEAFALTAEEIAKKAGLVLLSHQGKIGQAKTKSYYWDLVTIADTASEEVILGEIRKHYPNHSIVSEESGEMLSSQSDFTWFVDPLDGTTNYSHQFPMFAVSMGLQYKDELIAGIIYDPLRNELFKAIRGKGAFLNGNAIKVSSVNDLKGSLLATGFAYDRNETSDNNYAEFIKLTNVTQGVRRLGSAALDLAYVACGRLDGYWERGLKPWDMAAGVLLVQEAGGKATSYDKGPVTLLSGRVLATNGHLHDPLSEELK